MIFDFNDFLTCRIEIVVKILVKTRCFLKYYLLLIKK